MQYHQQVNTNNQHYNQQQDKIRYQLPPKQFDFRCHQEDTIRNQQTHLPPAFHESIADNTYKDMYNNSIKPINDDHRLKQDVLKHQEVTSAGKNQLTVSEEYEQYTTLLLEKRESTESGYETKRSSSECDSNNS